MSKQIDSLSVFFPAYNEEANIKETITKAKKILNDIASKWEIIVVDDGSKDKTGKVVTEISKSEKRVRLVTHSPNRGYGAALKSGFSNSKYPWIVFTDADGQFDFAEVTRFLDTQKQTKADIVIGYYKKRQVSFLKILTSKIWEYIVFILFGLKVHDIDCGFKLLSKKAIDSISPLESERGAFISSEFLIKAKKKGYKIVEIPITHYARTAGSGTGRNLNVIIKSFIDLFSLWKKLR